MSAILDTIMCLKLNAHWQAIAQRSVRDAITDMTSESPGRKPALALDITYGHRPDGTVDYDNILAGPYPLTWDDWVKSGRGVKIRVPTLLVAPNFARMPLKHFKPNRRSVFERDRGICQVTGQYVGWNGGNLDHVDTPKSVMRKRGLRDTFENLVWMDRKLNTKKGDRPLSALGLRLIRPPRAPKPVPLSATFKVLHPSWQTFLNS